MGKPKYNKNKADNGLTSSEKLGIEGPRSIYLTDSKEMNHNLRRFYVRWKCFYKIYELGIKPNAVTFSAILNACRYVSILFLLSVNRCLVRILFLSDASKL